MMGHLHKIPTGGAVAALLMATAAPAPAATPADSAIQQAVQDVSDGTISIAIFDRATNTTIGTHQPDTPWYTESIVKLLIGLYSMDHGGSASQVSEMISRSDDDTADELWDDLGGTRIVTSMATKIGLTHTTPPANPNEWGDTRVTANDLVLIYRYIFDKAPATERSTIINAMHDATNLGEDGTDQYFGIPYAVGSSTYWAVKQGWACCEPGWVLNTSGIIGTNQRYIVVALTSHDTGAGNAVFQQDSNELTQAIKDLLPDLAS
jgi:D-alanyl-D-alanine carboxypeptidase